MDKILKIVKIPNCSEDAERVSTYTLLVGLTKSVILKIVCLFLIKLNMQLSYYLATELLSIYHRKRKLCSDKNLYKNVYSNFTLNIKTGNNPRYPSLGEQINKSWYINSMEWCSATKRKELLKQYMQQLGWISRESLTVWITQ